MTAITLKNLTRRFGETLAADDISLHLPAGSFTALLGASGCGKSTLLRLVAGFEAPDAGEVRFDDRLIADPRMQVPPEARGVGVVFQSYALWPHMDVAGNVAYPLKTRRLPRAQIEAKVAEVLEVVGLEGFAGRRIEALSGGQRQRVALARCLVADAGIILFDEPLANLDMHLRASMVEAFREVHARTGATILYVTHDQAEALALADQVAVMDNGRVLQLAPATEVYHAPADRIVAGFVGRGAVVNGLAGSAASARTVTVSLGSVPVEARSAGPVSGPVRVLLRPEALRPSDAGLPATVVSSTYRGPVHEVHALLAETNELVLFDTLHPLRSGEALHLRVADAWIIPGA